MSDDRDPLLESIFEQANDELNDVDFVDNVMARVARRRRNVLLGRIGLVAVLVAFEFMLSAPLQNSVGIASQALGASLLEVNNEWLGLIVAPINSVAGIIGMVLLGLHTLHRRIVR